MKNLTRKQRRILIGLGLVLLTAALVWAAAELAGQASSMAQDAGSNSAEMEMVTLQTIKKPQKTKSSPTPPPCDWQKETQLRRQIDANDRQYRGMVNRAKSEMRGSGQVAAGTKQQLMSSANEFKNLCYQYAAMWDQCNCKTRARTARSSGDSRVKSAAVVAGGLEEDNLSSMRKAQGEMRSARRSYVQEAVAGDELSADDKKSIQAEVVPRTRTLLNQVQMLVTNVTSLLSKIQGTVSGGTPTLSVTDITKIATGGDPTAGLLSAVKNLLSVVQDMLSNVQALMQDAQSLATGSAPSGGMTSGVSSPMGSCFISTTEE